MNNDTSPTGGDPLRVSPLVAGSSAPALSMPDPGPIPGYQQSQPYYVHPAMPAYEVPAATPVYERKGSKLRWAVPILLVLLAAGAVFGFNYLQLQSPMQKVIDNDSRNSGVQVSTHYQNYINPSTLVYDLQSVAGDKSETDIFRVFLQYAEQMQNQRFTTVELAYKGETKFTLDGGYFQQLGQEYSWQNPVYTIRTFPENLLLPTGSHAYSQWTGGALGVTSAQLNDFDAFQKQWFLSDMIAGR